MAKIANRLFFGDNLDILRDYIKDETVDLIYLDPPFNSNRDYNVLFKDQSGKKSEAQITAFTDTWEWGPTASEALYHLERHENDKVRTAVTALHALLGENAMLAYLIMMTDRLVELHRALKPTGSLYLHCDPTASHYLKIVLDAIFGVENFRNEIAWKRTSSHNDSSKKYGRIHDVIFFYTKSQKYTWNTVYQPYEESYVDKYYKHKDEDGRRYMDDNLSAAGLSGGGYTYEWKGVTKIWRVPETSMQELDSQNRIYYTRNDTARIKRYLDEMKGLPAGDIWTDISALNSQAKERLGYPTQKPSELLERIIAASSNPGD
ncbi:MAG: DNA methyltransferase, partial [Aggregatilineales bacterium]